MLAKFFVQMAYLWPKSREKWREREQEREREREREGIGKRKSLLLLWHLFHTEHMKSHKSQTDMYFIHTHTLTHLDAQTKQQHQQHHMRRQKIFMIYCLWVWRRYLKASFDDGLCQKHYATSKINNKSKRRPKHTHTHLLMY